MEKNKKIKIKNKLLVNFVKIGNFSFILVFSDYFFNDEYMITFIDCFICIYQNNHGGFPCTSNGKDSACNARDLGSIPGFGRSPGEGNGNSLQYSCLQKSLTGYSPWGCKESDTTEWLTHKSNHEIFPLYSINILNHNDRRF